MWEFQVLERISRNKALTKGHIAAHSLLFKVKSNREGNATNNEHLHIKF